MNVAIIGCGFIGQKRANALAGTRLRACADIIEGRARSLALKHPGAVVLPDWRLALELPDIDIVIVATTHNVLAEITLAAVMAGKHVLVEKPAARRTIELDPVIVASKKKEVRVRVGFNHRYHPSFIKAREIIAANEVGELMFIRGRYGHGGRVGYEKEWRAVEEMSGGGELIDQGVHLIDLARTFLGEFQEVQGFAHTYYWDMPVEDNGFMLLKTNKKQVALLHAGWTEWKNIFSFEITGRNAKLEIAGLGGSYGTERLTYYKMLPQMGPPETIIWEYPMADKSWEVEFAEFLDDIRLARQPAAGLYDARAALQIVEKIYEISS
jgi:predicted dehydrogenase